MLDGRFLFECTLGKATDAESMSILITKKKQHQQVDENL